MTPQDLLQNRNPASYAAASILMNEVSNEMMARLEWMALQPDMVLDLSCGLGESARLLVNYYPEARIVSANPAHTLLKHAKQEGVDGVEWLHAPMEKLPFRDHSVDLITANLLLPWYTDLATLFSEWRRVLRPEGLLMFTTLGPDTLKEFHHCSTLTFPHCIDMHHIGDALIQAGFIDPVLDMEYITLTYQEPTSLWAELKALSMMAGDVGQIALQPNDDGIFPVTYEVIYGHAWNNVTDVYSADETGVVRVPVSRISRR